MYHHSGMNYLMWKWPRHYFDLWNQLFFLLFFLSFKRRKVPPVSLVFSFRKRFFNPIFSVSNVWAVSRMSPTPSRNSTPFDPSSSYALDELDCNGLMVILEKVSCSLVSAEEETQTARHSRCLRLLPIHSRLPS